MQVVVFTVLHWTMVRKILIQNLRRIKKFFVSIYHRCYCGLAINAHTHATPTLGDLSVSNRVEKYENDAVQNDSEIPCSHVPSTNSPRGNWKNIFWDIDRILARLGLPT